MTFLFALSPVEILEYTLQKRIEDYEQTQHQGYVSKESKVRIEKYIAVLKEAISRLNAPLPVESGWIKVDLVNLKNLPPEKEVVFVKYMMQGGKIQHKEAGMLDIAYNGEWYMQWVGYAGEYLKDLVSLEWLKEV